MPLCKWHSLRMVPWLICFFIIILFYIRRNWLFGGNLATVLPLKSNLFGKFHLFNAIDGSIKMLKYSWLSIRAIKSKSFLRRYTAIYGYLFSQYFENAVLGCLEMMQWNFFLTPTISMFAKNVLKRVGFCLFCGSMFFHCWVSWVSWNNWGFLSGSVL